MKKKYSELQLQVLRFYRAYLIFAKSKPDPLRTQLQIQARSLLEKHRSIPRRNYQHIEFVLRQESNKLQMLKNANISSIGQSK